MWVLWWGNASSLTYPFPTPRQAGVPLPGREPLDLPPGRKWLWLASWRLKVRGPHRSWDLHCLLD